MLLFIIVVFLSCSIPNKNICDKQVSKNIVSHYAATEQESDSLTGWYLKQRDTFYYDREQVSYREVELTFSENNSDRITSYVLDVAKKNSKGKMAKAAYYLPIQPDGSLEKTSHLKNGTGQAKQRWIYVYNNDGRWIRRVEYRKGKPYSISEREFEYYKNDSLYRRNRKK